MLQGTLDIMVLQTLRPGTSMDMPWRRHRTGIGRQSELKWDAVSGLIRLEQRGFVAARECDRKHSKDGSSTPPAARSPRRRSGSGTHGHHMQAISTAEMVRCYPRWRADSGKSTKGLKTSRWRKRAPAVDMIADELKRRGLSFEDDPARRECGRGIASREQRGAAVDAAGRGPHPGPP